MFQIRKFLYYFGSTVILGFVFYLGWKYQLRLRDDAKATFEIMPVLLFATIFPIVIGILLRLPKLIMEIKKEKNWTFDWIKIVAIGVPALYVTFIPILVHLSFGVNFPFANNIVFLSNASITTTAGIVFGYVLLDSLKK